MPAFKQLSLSPTAAGSRPARRGTPGWNRLLAGIRRDGAALPLALAAGVVAAIVVVATWQLLRERAHEQIHAATHHTGSLAEMLIREDIAHRLAAVEQLARYWRDDGGRPPSSWRTEAEISAAKIAGFEAVEWADTDLNIRWSVPLAGDGAVQDLHRSGIQAALAGAQLHGGTTLTQPFALARGGLGIAAFTPVWQQRRFNGVIIGVFSLQACLDGILTRLQNSEHSVRILVEGREACRNGPGTASWPQKWTRQRVFEAHGLSWAILISPTAEFVAAIHADSSKLILAMGLLFSVLVGAAIYLARAVRCRAHQLYSTSSQLAALIQNLPGIAYRCVNQPEWPMEFVSEGCQQLSGHAREDFEQRRVFWGELIHTGDRQRIWQNIQQAIDAGEAFEIEYRIVNRKNEERWVWERGRTIQCGENQLVRIEGIISDITDRKRAEIALLEARAFSEAVVDTAAEAVITIDANGIMQTCNRAAQDMFGYPAAEMQGRNVGLLMPEPYRSEHGRYIQRYLRSGEAHIIGSGREVSAQRKDGSEFPIHLSVSEVPELPQRRFVGLIRDISRQRAAEMEARQHREQLAHLDRLNMLGEMATGIAHEINQPLTAISLFAQAGKRLFDTGERARVAEIFDKLSQHAQRAGAVIERMQTMARHGKSAREIADCNKLVAEIAKLAEAEARILDIAIAVQTRRNLPAVEVDTVQIQQVALNLLRNGMEAMRAVNCRHGKTSKLQTRQRGDGDIEVLVIDSGCGVSEKIAGKLFTPFSTTKDSGMGMGLSICRAIITAHGGQLSFHNNATAGATFLFTLPAAEHGDEHE